MTPRPLPNIEEIIPYVPGLAADEGYKLSSNENPLGCSPKATAALQDAISDLATYPDGGANRLRTAIGKRYGVDAARIICGAGSDEIFQMLARAFLQPGDEVIQSAHAFLVYRLVTQQAGATMISVPETDLCADVDAMLAAVTGKTKIVFLANPNNPTGSYLPFEEVRRLHAGLRGDILLVLDAAYAEYVTLNDYSSGLEMAGSYENVLMTRTFSKIHGLAALRLGWAYGPQAIIDTLNRVRGPFNVSMPAQVAGIAALEDEAFASRSAQFNNDELARVAPLIAKAGLTVFPSVANFLLIRFPDVEGKRSHDANTFLKNRGLTVRGVAPYGLKDCLRISIGVREANDQVVRALTDFMSAP